MPGGRFVDCTVCGFSLGAPGFCPACGSDNQSSEINVGRIDQVDLESDKTENPEILKEESDSITAESTVSSNHSPIKLPFGFEDAPLKNNSLAIPYGLDFAPFYRKK
jgi:hypothetical protein